jgi:hypothetical protein
VRGGASECGKFHRATIPHASHTPYAADQAFDYLEDMARLFGTETIEEKRMGAYSLIQRGIDNYAIFKMNIRFSSGAGQHLGKKPPITFFAAMYDDTTLLNEVRSSATDEFYESRAYFQEGTQNALVQIRSRRPERARPNARTAWLQNLPNVDPLKIQLYSMSGALLFSGSFHEQQDQIKIPTDLFSNGMVLYKLEFCQRSGNNSESKHQYGKALLF